MDHHELIIYPFKTVLQDTNKSEEIKLYSNDGGLAEVNGVLTNYIPLWTKVLKFAPYHRSKNGLFALLSQKMCAEICNICQLMPSE